MATISLTGLTVPNTLLTCANATIAVFGPNRSRYWSIFSSPRPSMSTTRRCMFFFSASNCQGTMLAWCSITVRIMSPPSGSSEPNDDATRFMPSVVPRVNITSRCDRALMYCATRRRVCSCMSVASWLRVCTPRCTFALWLVYTSTMASTTRAGVWLVAALSKYIRGRPDTCRDSIGNCSRIFAISITDISYSTDCWSRPGRSLSREPGRRRTVFRPAAAVCRAVPASRWRRSRRS